MSVHRHGCKLHLAWLTEANNHESVILVVFNVFFFVLFLQFHYGKSLSIKFFPLVFNQQNKCRFVACFHHLNVCNEVFLSDAALNVGDTVQRAFPVTCCEPACLNTDWTDRGVNPAWIPVCNTRCSFLSYRLHPPVYLEPVCAHGASLKPNSVRGLRQAAAGRRVEAAPCVQAGTRRP